MSGSYISKMVLKAWVRLAMPPNTELPSVKELVEAMTGSLKCRVRWLRW